MPIFDIKDKVALITGGASINGVTYAKELLKNGLRAVSLVDVSEKHGQRAVEQITKEFGPNKAIFVLTDVTNIKSFEDAFKETINQFKNIDILINCASILDDKNWEKQLNYNLKSVIHGMILGLENYLQKYRSGDEAVIINMNSIGAIEPLKELPIFTGTKFAVFGMSKAWGDEMHYQRTKIKVITICLGITDALLNKHIVERCLTSEYGKTLLETLHSKPSQTIESVAKGIVKIIETGKSGTGWVIEGGQEPYEFPLTSRSTFATKL